MTMDIYKQLADHLDQLPGGYPPTESGVELRILRRLFTPQQAELVILAQTHGRIQLVLRNAKDHDVAETEGVREGDLFGMPVRRASAPRPAPPAAVATVEPPPPSVAVEIIKGNQISVQEFPARGLQD